MIYIINPWIFYLISTLSGLTAIAAIVLIISVIGLIVSSAEEDLPNNFPKPKFFIITLIISILMLIFIPTEDTAYKMLVSSQVTSENIEIAGNTAKEVVDYIVDSVNKIKD